MLISEMSFSCLKWQMDRTLRAVVQAGIADLTAVRKRDFLLRHGDVIGRADPGTNAAVNAVVSDRIGESRILPQPALGQALPLHSHLSFEDRGDPYLDVLACCDLSTHRVQLPLHILLRERVDLLLHIEIRDKVVHHLNGIDVTEC